MVWTGLDDDRASGAKAAPRGCEGKGYKVSSLAGLALRVVMDEADKGKGIRFACCAEGV